MDGGDSAVAEAERVTILLTGLLIVVLVVLLVPVALVVQGVAGDEELGGFAELQWGTPLALLAVRVGSEKVAEVKVLRVRVLTVALSSDDASAKKKARKRSSSMPRWWSAGLRAAGIDRQVTAAMVRRVVRAVHPRMYVGGTVGLSDPMNTASMLMLARALDERGGRVLQVDLQDDFLGDETRLCGRMDAWLRPAEIGFLLLVWATRSSTRRIIRSLGGAIRSHSTPKE